MIYRDLGGLCIAVIGSIVDLMGHFGRSPSKTDIN